MKRNMDLLRNILFYVEDNYVAGGSAIQIGIDGYTQGEIYEHCLLAYEAGLIQKPIDVSTSNQKQCLVNNLTNSGFDYLDAIREDTIWNRTKQTIKEKGLPLIIDTIKTVSTAFIAAAAEGVANSIIKNGTP